MRRWTPNDRLAVRRLVETGFREYGLWRDHRAGMGDVDDVASAYLRPGGEFLVAAAGGRIVGCGGLRPRRGGAAGIQRMFVAPAFRGKGLGRRLLSRLIAAARRRGFRRLDLETSPRFQDAIRLYLAFGFDASVLDVDNCCNVAMFRGV